MTAAAAFLALCGPTEPAVISSGPFIFLFIFLDLLYFVCMSVLLV